MITLHHKNMVKGLALLKAPEKLCKGCLIGKQHRESFPKQSQWRASHRLQLIHADICGPVTPESNNGKKYLITFIDDFTRKIWVFFLTEKSEAFVTFKNFQVTVENEINRRICCLRTDRGGEFISEV